MFARKYIKPLQNSKVCLVLLLGEIFKKRLETSVSVVEADIDYKIFIQLFNYDVSEFLDFLKRCTYRDLKVR